MTSGEQDRLREAVGEDVEGLPAVTAAGNVDADSAGPDAAVFGDGGRSGGSDPGGDEEWRLGVATVGRCWNGARSGGGD
jgi:hypothetical protein